MSNTNNTPASNSKKRAAPDDDNETSASKRSKNARTPTTLIPPKWAGKTGRPAAYDEDLAPPARRKHAQQQDLKARAIKQLRTRKEANQAVTKTASKAIAKTPATTHVSPVAIHEETAPPVAHEEYLVQTEHAAETGAAVDTAYVAEESYEEQVDYGEDAYYNDGAEYAAEGQQDGTAEYLEEQHGHQDDTYDGYAEDHVDYIDTAEVAPKDDEPPAACHEDLSPLGQVHGDWEATRAHQLRQKFPNYGPQQHPPYPPRAMYPPRPSCPSRPFYTPQGMYGAQFGWNQPMYKLDPNTPARPSPAATPVQQSRAGTPSSTITNEYGYTIKFNDSPRPAANKEATAEECILTLLSDKPATTTFPNPAQLKHPSLARLDYSLSSLIEPSSTIESMHKKYSGLLQASTKNEREISDLLKLVKMKGQTAMVSTLEGKLVEERERRIRAEGIVQKTEALKVELGKVAEKVVELDGAVWEVVKGVKELLETDTEGV